MIRKSTLNISIRKWIICLSVVFASVSFSTFISEYMGINVDDLYHDWVLTQTPRNSWTHTSILYLDDGVPFSISRKQTIGLYALAIKRLIAQGAEAVLFDGTLYEYNNITRLAECLNGAEIKWKNELDMRPLSILTQEELSRVLMPKPYNNVPLSVFVSPFIDFGFQRRYQYVDLSAAKMSESGTSSILRHQLLNKNSGATALADRISAVKHDDFSEGLFQCSTDSCIRVRQSKAFDEFQGPSSVLTLSEWSQCDALGKNVRLDGKAIILQFSNLTEPTDLHLTPLSHHFTDNKLISGAHFLADATETLIKKDMPIRPSWIVVFSVFGLVALVLAFAVLYGRIRFSLGILIAALVFNFVAPFITPFELWPFSLGVLIFLSVFAIGSTVAIYQNSKFIGVMKSYLPMEVQKQVMVGGNLGQYVNRKISAVVLLSDLRAYTEISEKLENPQILFKFLNYYFKSVTGIVQNEFSGWLESYSGDQITFYWPILDENETETVELVEQAANHLEREFDNIFNKLLLEIKSSYVGLGSDSLAQIRGKIGAGVGISFGEVFIGHLGKNSGVMKFGIIGSPINDASRIESLSKVFSSDVFATEDFVSLSLSQERWLPLIRLRLKGWQNPKWVFIHKRHDAPANERDTWLNAIKSIQDSGTLDKPITNLLSYSTRDAEVLLDWYKKGFWSEDKECWRLSQKV